MASGVYGTVRPANITMDDIEMYYNKRTNRTENTEEALQFHPLESSYLTTVNVGSGEQGDIPNTTLFGMYNLKLPLDIFGDPGVYTVYIKPKEVVCEIQKIGVLTAYPDVRGIVIAKSDLNGITDATGYRVEFFNDSGEREDFFRIVTSMGYVEPVSQNLSSSFTNQIGYRYNDAASLAFLTVTPSTATDFNANDVPYIGQAGQTISLMNTKFNPVAIEIEVVEHDEETLAYMLMGDQIRDLDHGLVTTYNFNNEIYHQSEHFIIKSTYTGTPIYEVRERRTDNIDFSQDHDSILNQEFTQNP